MKDINIIVPLAGVDKNFEDRGMIKPLTKVLNKEIIRWIEESRPFSYKKAIFVILREHQERYGIGNELKRFFGEDIRIVVAEKMTEGSPQSILLARDLINNDKELLIDLADQYLDLLGFNDFIRMKRDEVDGIIFTFKAYYWNQGYMIIGRDGFIKKISEKDKNPISEDSTACISYFRRGSDFVKYAEKMINKKKTATNGTYLPSLVYNEMIKDGRKIIPASCDFIVNLGRIEGINAFQQLNRPLKWKEN